MVCAAIGRAAESGDVPQSKDEALLRSAIDLISEGINNDLIAAEFEEEVWSAATVACAASLAPDDAGAPEL